MVVPSKAIPVLRKLTFWSKSLAFAACLLGACAAHGFDSYLKIDTIDGESKDSQHLKWIVILSFAQGATQTGSAAFSDVCLQKLIDTSSPVLAQSCAQGTHFTYALLELVAPDANRTRFYQLGLTNVVVTRLSTAENPLGELPTETLCLSYARIGWNYTEVDAQDIPVGALGSWWDLGRNIGGTNTLGLFTVSATQIRSGTLQLSWPGKSGQTYNILGSPTVTGTYQLIQSLTAPSDGVMNLPVPITSGAKFFRVQEAP